MLFRNTHSASTSICLMAAAAYTFADVLDFVGYPVESWPRLILASYQKARYTAQDRLKLCIFNFMNGFDNRIFLEFARARGALADRRAIEDVIHISSVLEGRELHMHEWYSWCLAEHRWCYLDGTTKFY